MLNNKIYLPIKLLLFLLNFYLIFHFIGNKEYNCIDNCSLSDAGGILALFLLLCSMLFYYEKARTKVLNILKIYIPAFFLLYSSVFYIDSIQYEQEIIAYKNFVEFKIKYLELENKNISTNKLTSIADLSFQKINIPFDKYVNKTLPQYKDTIGRAMMGLTIGVFTFLILEILSFIFTAKHKV